MFIKTFRLFVWILVFSLNAHSSEIRVVYECELRLMRGIDANQIIKNIEKISSRNNKQKGIGGMILFNLNGNRVLQVLEGKSDAINELIEKIKANPFTKDFTEISHEDIYHRSYPNWGMGLKASRFSNDLWDILKDLQQAQVPRTQVTLSSVEKEDLAKSRIFSQRMQRKSL